MKIDIPKALAVLVFVVIWSSKAAAGLIIASGDSTPIAYLANPSNGLFFSNVLGTGTSVVVHELPPLTVGNALSDYYDSLPGVSSTYVDSGEITAGMLSGVDLFVTSLWRAFGP
jgi:hypothetical protein